MTTLTIPITAYSVQAAKSGQKFGQLASLPILNAASEVFFRASLSKIPDEAVVSSAYVDFWCRTDEAGDRLLKVAPVSASAKWDSNVTWAKKPASDAAAASVTFSAPKANDRLRFDVTSTVQSMVSGLRKANGWRLYGDATTANEIRVNGSSAASRKPVLTVTYTVPPPAPENLHPAGGAVSVAKPTLTFDAVDSINSLQVQIDPAMSEMAPGFDSGTVAAAGGMLDLTTTSYAGLAAGATTYWRARQKTGSWSDWSDWVTMTRTLMPTLTILNPPAGDIEDGTPPVQWSFTGTQVAWQARLLNASGDVLDDSEYTPGTDTTWTPTKGLKRDGQVGTFEVLVWDDQDRATTPGDPEYAQATVAVTFRLDPTVDPMTSLAVQQDDIAPDVTLVGSRAEIPDEVDIFRDGDFLVRLVGTDVFRGTAFRWTDTTPPTARPVTYRVAPRVNGKTAGGGPTVTTVSWASGIWLKRLDTGDRIVLWTGQPGSSTPETSIIHTPLNEVQGLGQVVRRRIARYRPQDTVTGTIMDTPDMFADVPDAMTTEALLREWAEADAGTFYWLIFGGFSEQVIIGDLDLTERDVKQSGDNGRLVDVTFNYWGQV